MRDDLDFLSQLNREDCDLYLRQNVFVTGLYRCSAPSIFWGSTMHTFILKRNQNNKVEKHSEISAKSAHNFLHDLTKKKTTNR